MKIKDMQFSAKKMAILSALTALGLLAFLLENLLPPLFVPGAKTGLSNIFTLLALVWFSPAEAFLVLVVRTVLGSIFAGNVSALLYSLTAGAVSLAAASLLFKLFSGKLTVVSISAFSACVHNAVQLCVYSFLTANAGVFGYLPFLLLAGVLSGVVVGVLTLVSVRVAPLRLLYAPAELEGTAAEEKGTEKADAHAAEASAERSAETPLPADEQEEENT